VVIVPLPPLVVLLLQLVVLPLQLVERVGTIPLLLVVMMVLVMELIAPDAPVVMALLLIPLLLAGGLAGLETAGWWTLAWLAGSVLVLALAGSAAAGLEVKLREMAAGLLALAGSAAVWLAAAGFSTLLGVPVFLLLEGVVEDRLCPP
jgi:hypothetical protein